MSNWEREYIVQAFVNSANDLRLNSHRVVLINMIKDFLYKCEDIDFGIAELKKITEFSKFAIRLGQLNLFTKQKPDFLLISSIIKSESQSLIPIIQQMLDSLSVEFANEKLLEIKEKFNSDVPLKKVEVNKDASVEKEELRKSILSFIRKADVLLSEFDNDENDVVIKDEILSELSFLRSRLIILNNDLVDNMFSIFDSLLAELQNDENREEIIEALRASMIVIVATIREKDVDLKPFIERAMNFFEIKKENE